MADALVKQRLMSGSRKIRGWLANRHRHQQNWLAGLQLMRHASQLCRGLAEAARSIERPYVPRHIPLPSSSYSAAAQTSSTSSAPGPSTTEPNFSRAAAPQRNDRPVGVSEAVNPSLLPSTQDHSSSTASYLRNQVPRSAVLHIERRNEDATSHTKAAPPIEPVSTQSALRNTDSLTQNTRRRANAGTRFTVDASSKSAPRSSTIRLSTSDEPHPKQLSRAQSKLSREGAKRDIEYVKATYPHLDEPQAGLLVRTSYQINSLRSQAPSAVMAWYEDFVWTTERHSQNSQKSESLESLSMLLRFAYQRNDLRSLLRLESRAMRIPSIAKQSRVNFSPTDTISKRMRGPEEDGVHLWPSPNENPILLAHNLKIGFAAREGNWVRIEQLLDSASLAGQSSSKAVRVGHDSSLMTRSAYVLDAIGWGILLRFGLGNVQRHKSRNVDDTPRNNQALQDTKKTDTVSSTSTSDVLLQDEITKAADDEAQMQSKLSVTKRLLPDLLRYTNESSRHVRPEGTSATGPAKESAAKFGGGTTPAWLLQSVLTQLAERGELVSTIKIVQLALSEGSSTVKRDSTRDARPTHILNLVLMACHRNHKVNLAETLRIFNSLTGSRLGESVSGSAVLAEPTVIERGRDQQSPPSKSLQKDAEKADAIGRPAAEGQSGMRPNEESLVLILKKVRHPLFRASWTRKLVAEFERFFPQVKLSGRSYRMIIDKCVTPGSASQSRDTEMTATTEMDSTRVAAERIVASGRRGRRLRQEAATASQSIPSASSSIKATSHSAGPARTPRPPIVKQSMLSTTLDEILNRFDGSRPSSCFHLSTTNRRRFEHTLLRAKRLLLQKKASHLHKLQPCPTTTDTSSAQAIHHTSAISQIDTLLDKLAQVQRLGRRQEAHSKRQARTQSDG
ncbi:L-aminoadipate-semialdehyde dehydrogenase [Pseudozyma hubeiensis SY62]|uniref:L-aminoadipate-semialdehyde dehydrogenase n=1 Tax=Pseudozyma hubeiensis (strain SY62) TaxID=1305764 RepID=R9P4E0_PSEHS|nr:L-aminoadipate-semialdehyde dehydrogenase [Pseudozyma hubeiensis SY62]GAC96293.1 L-aminoadipate-semialdehyde dehydrogenase [Pseudozyma hubeiensis SY62]